MRVATGVPGFIIPRDSPAELFTQATSSIMTMAVHHDDALNTKNAHSSKDFVTPTSEACGRVRLSIVYEDGTVQTVHYFATKESTTSVTDVGSFLTEKHWLEKDDPFGESPSIMGNDYEVGVILEQDGRVKSAGLSDERGSSAYVALSMKQIFHPNSDEILKLDRFVTNVLWGSVQLGDYGVIRSAFFYEPALMQRYVYNSRINCCQNPALNRSKAFETNRA
ncbi:unnamed protein product [Clonostachys rosea]|uniref:Uncharacterized protein n=1 Tax=Bionectria ochroleuca TaxID=29856 RepID=A0ABY6UMN3_BIOOC|nr:unnamed protein product [Clonostachys rosea]